jgi:uncharacterized protein YdeI (YjbR/CyaY-like superfamily)
VLRQDGAVSAQDDAERVHAETRAAWRAWLAEHAATAGRAWLVSWRAGTGRPVVAYDAAVTEALAFGWVDSVQREVDDDRTMLCSTARRPGSAWSRPNEVRVEALEREGLMTDAGRRVVEAAKADGSWTVLDDVEDLVVPPDLAEAFARHPGSRERWDAFPRSPRRGILEWIVQAERPETRARRVEETAAMAARGERADHWRPREGAG